MLQFEPELSTFQSNELGNPNALNTVAFNFELLLDEKPIYPAFAGYYGWNYEAAVALEAQIEYANLDSVKDTLIPQKVDAVLEDALQFPHAGSFMKIGLPTFWFYSCGDRIGLFGSLYKNIDERVYETSVKGTSDWRGVGETQIKTRNVGYDLVSLRKKYVWVDDVYMGGQPLLTDPSRVNETRAMILGSFEIAMDEEKGLFYHGLELDKDVLTVISNNGHFWGRANGWILLTMARYLKTVPEDDEVVELMREYLTTLTSFQRVSGAFGNLIDQDDTIDEVSLTSIFIYAIAIYQQVSSDSSFETFAFSAFNWLNTRQVEGTKASNVCGAAPVTTIKEAYAERTTGLQTGPGVAFMLWARVGAKQLEFL